jgi:hypothetical protein
VSESRLGRKKYSVIENRVNPPAHCLSANVPFEPAGQVSIFIWKELICTYLCDRFLKENGVGIGSCE